jgi:hypothetical protein
VKRSQTAVRLYFRGMDWPVLHPERSREQRKTSRSARASSRISTHTGIPSHFVPLPVPPRCSAGDVIVRSFVARFQVSSTAKKVVR